MAATHQSDGSKKYDKCREHPSILWRIRSVDQASTAGDRVMANDRMNFRGFELSDADRALVRSSDEHGLSHLENKIRKARLYTRPLTSVRAEIDGVRSTENKQLKAHEVNRIGSSILARDLLERGRLYHDGRVAYFYSHETKAVIPVDSESSDFLLLTADYGIGARDAMFKPMMSALDIAGRQFGTSTEVYTFAHYNRERSTLYVFDQDRWVYRLGPTRTERVENGTGCFSSAIRNGSHGSCWTPCQQGWTSRVPSWAKSGSSTPFSPTLSSSS